MASGSPKWMALGLKHGQLENVDTFVNDVEAGPFVLSPPREQESCGELEIHYYHAEYETLAAFKMAWKYSRGRQLFEHRIEPFGPKGRLDLMLRGERIENIETGKTYIQIKHHGRLFQDNLAGALVPSP